MQPVRRSSSERSTIQYVDEDAPTPRRIARGSLTAGRLAARFQKAKEPSTVRVDPASLEPLLERARSSTTEMRPLFDRDDEATRPLEYDGVTVPRDRLELAATQPATRSTGMHGRARSQPAAPEGVALPTPVGPFATVGPESTVTGELAYDLLALIVPPRTSARMERVEAPIESPIEVSELIEVVDRAVRRPAIYPIEPVRMAPRGVPTIGGRPRWIATLVLLVAIATIAFAATIAAAQLGLLR